MPKLKKNKGYSLTEFIIVFAVLFAVSYFIVPQLSQATYQARGDSLTNNIIKLSDAVDIYRADHNGQLPYIGKTGLIQSLCGQTDIFGSLYSDSAAELGLAKLGPYLEKIPVNPFNDLNTIRVNGKSAGANTHGYRYDSFTGKFEPDNINNDKFQMTIVK